MKPFYVKAVDVSYEKQQELLDLAVDAGATLDEHRLCTRHVTFGNLSETINNFNYFGVDCTNGTNFSYGYSDFGDNAVEMTYDQAWEYVTGIIRNSERSYTRDEMIDWLRENTTRENWENQDSTIVLPKPWRVTWNSTIMEKVVDDIYSPGSDITKTNVFPPETPRSPLFDRIKQALGSREVEIAGEDHLVGQVKGDAHKARILDNIIKEFKVYPGQDVIIALKARLEVAKESPAPRSASPENIEKEFRNAYSGVHATPITESVGSPKLDRSKPRNKYDHEIIPGVHVDVYDVLNAFPTGGADIDHAVKKLLKPGGRGHKDEITDCEEAIKSIQRRIDHIKEWGGQ